MPRMESVSGQAGQGKGIGRQGGQGQLGPNLRRRWWAQVSALCAALLCASPSVMIGAAPGGTRLPSVRQKSLSESASASSRRSLPHANRAAATTLALIVHTGMSTDQQMADLRGALRSFLETLPSSMEVLLVPFDESVQSDLPLTSDRRQLLQLVDRLRPGQGADLYGAVNRTLDRLSSQPGPRTILLIADGIDWRTHSGIGEETLRRVERAGIPIHAVQLKTRPDAEEMAQNQREMLGQADFGLIFGGPSSRKRRTPPPPPEPEPTLEEDGKTPQPRSASGPGTLGSRPAEVKKDDPYKLPVPTIDLPPPRRQRFPGPEAEQGPQPGRLPPQPQGRVPEERFPDATRPGRSAPEPPAGGGGFPGTARARPDPIRETLDQLYQAADVYLTTLARLSGGTHRQADSTATLASTLGTLPRSIFSAP